MITEDYVSFETAKLLKEKGFDEYGMYFYTLKDEGREGYKSNKRLGELAHNSSPDLKERAVSCPTLQMAVKWLREKHNQNITVKAHNNVARAKTIYYAEVQNLSEPAEKGFCVNGCTFKDTYEEAVDYAIRYCLENLI